MNQLICEAALIYLACGIAVTLTGGTPLEIIDDVTRDVVRRKGRLPGRGRELLAVWVGVVVWPKVLWGMAR